MTNEELKAKTILITDPEHPHHGATGAFTGKIITTLAGEHMAEVRFDEPSHGVEACFVSRGQVTTLKETP